MADQANITGGCHCGKIRYTASAPVIHKTHCHCDICRAFGGTLMSWITVKKDNFDMTGSTIKKYQSSTTAYREFCSDCGTHLTFRHTDSPELVDITIGSLDKPSDFPPNNQIWGNDKLSYLDEMASLPMVPGNNL